MKRRAIILIVTPKHETTMKLSPVQRLFKAMRDTVNDCVKNSKVIDLKGAVDAGQKSWEICDDDDVIHGIADLVYRHMILEGGDGDAIVLIGSEFPKVKEQLAQEISKRCYWMRNWSDSYRKVNSAYCEDDVAFVASNESIVLTSNSSIYDDQPGWVCLKVEYMSSSSRKTSPDASKNAQDR